MRSDDRDRLLSLRWRITACVAVAGMSAIAVVLVAEEASALATEAQDGTQASPGGGQLRNPLFPGSLQPGRPGRGSVVSGGS